MHSDYYGPKGVAQYFAERDAGAPTLKPNVSKEADAAFIRELQRTDLDRYERLQRSMRLTVKRQRRPSSIDKRVKQAKAMRAKSRTAKTVVAA